jgi:hypothetical protein
VVLKGLKVVEYASYIAAPGAAGIMADWGADVIKVERPEGDPMRHVFADVKGGVAGNPTFGLDNRGKRAVVLDTSKPAGRDALAKLAVEADVFLTNVRPASLKRAGLDDATLREANPRLVYAVVTGYGLDGPDADKPGSTSPPSGLAPAWPACTRPRAQIPSSCAPASATTSPPWPRSRRSWRPFTNASRQASGGWSRPRSWRPGSTRWVRTWSSSSPSASSPPTARAPSRSIRSPTSTRAATSAGS